MIRTLKLSIFLLTFLVQTLHAQWSEVQYIDSTNTSVGIHAIEHADIDHDGKQDILVSQTGSNGKLAFYKNLGTDAFSPSHTIDSVPFMQQLTTADFDGNGWTDIAAIGGIDHSVFIYLNEEGSFTQKIHLDSMVSLAVNDIVSADFDRNGTADIVVIGQHSIDLYLNPGNAQFEKSAILTTQSSPKQLECLDLSLSDMNHDGWPDLVCAETAGLVVYMNEKDSTFTPHYYSEVPEIGLLLHTVDMDGDGDTDAVMENSFGEIKWFSNDGTGRLSFRDTIPFPHDLHAIHSVDHNGDGRMDLLVSYLHHVSLLINDPGEQFQEEVRVFEDSSLYMDAVAAEMLFEQGNYHYIWSGGTRDLAYRTLNTSSTLSQNQIRKALLYPNPSEGQISIELDRDKKFDIHVFTVNGKRVFQRAGLMSNNTIRLDFLPPGIYYVKICPEDATVNKKLLLH